MTISSSKNANMNILIKKIVERRNASNHETVCILNRFRLHLSLSVIGQMAIRCQRITIRQIECNWPNGNSATANLLNANSVT